MRTHDNLTKAQRTLLRLHHRFGHASMFQIQQWAKQGLCNIPIDVASVPDLPVCLACACGTAKRRGHNKATGNLGAKATVPGDFISVDTLTAGTPGITPFSSGREPKRRYTNSTFWVDKVSK